MLDRPMVWPQLSWPKPSGRNHLVNGLVVIPIAVLAVGIRFVGEDSIDCGDLMTYYN